VHDAVKGRWLSRDPLGENGDSVSNLYLYVLGNPVTYFGPLGLQATGTGSPYLPDPSMKPLGWDRTWLTGQDARGHYSQNPWTGEKWYPHPEDKGHWSHYDSEKKGNRYPANCFKPREGQLRPPYGNQSATNPWSNLPRWGGGSVPRGGLRGLD
jgi:hypothetical protein